MLQLHVLLAGADAAARRSAAAALGRDPFFIVRDCACGAAALTAAVAWRPDLVLLDAALPDIDGAALIRGLRADARTAPIPVVLLSGREDPRRRRRGRAYGVIGMIAKPFDPTTLAAELRRFVAVESVLSPAREGFLRRLQADADALSDCRRRLLQTQPQDALTRINEIAHALAGAGGIYGFAGISCASAALSDAAENNLAGRAKPVEVERALNRLLERIAPL